MLVSRSDGSGPEGEVCADGGPRGTKARLHPCSVLVTRGFRLDGMSRTQHHKPLGVLDAVAVSLGVA